MRRSRFSEEQIIGILREEEAGVKVADVCRKHGISDATFYAWKAKYGGLEVSEARRLIAAWRIDYNATRPHSSLGNRTPLAYAHLSDPAMRRGGSPELVGGPAPRPVASQTTRMQPAAGL